MEACASALRMPASLREMGRSGAERASEHRLTSGATPLFPSFRVRRTHSTDNRTAQARQATRLESATRAGLGPRSRAPGPDAQPGARAGRAAGRPGRTRGRMRPSQASERAKPSVGRRRRGARRGQSWASSSSSARIAAPMAAARWLRTLRRGAHGLARCSQSAPSAAQ